MRTYIAACSIALVASLGVFMVQNQRVVNTYGTVIVLNGPSAAGKSSIQKEFQNLMMPRLWIKLGIDNLFDKPMPDIDLSNLAYWQKENPIRWVETTEDEHQHSVITLLTGVEGEKVAYGMNSAIAAYAQAGCNVIVDYIAYRKEWLDDLRAKLADINVHWIKVHPPLAVLEEREVARGTSPKGHARSHYDFVHWDIKYDLEVDSSLNTAAGIAEKVKAFLEL
jgi:chloramphenicol 3-O phosphotransferase